MLLLEVALGCPQLPRQLCPACVWDIYIHPVVHNRFVGGGQGLGLRGPYTAAMHSCRGSGVRLVHLLLSVCATAPHTLHCTRTARSDVRCSCSNRQSVVSGHPAPPAADLHCSAPLLPPLCVMTACYTHSCMEWVQSAARRRTCCCCCIHRFPLTLQSRFAGCLGSGRQHTLCAENTGELTGRHLRVTLCALRGGCDMFQELFVCACSHACCRVARRGAWVEEGGRRGLCHMHVLCTGTAARQSSEGVSPCGIC